MSAGVLLTTFAEQRLSNKRVAPPAIELRIEELTASLRSSANIIGAIEAEINQRRVLLAELQRDARNAEALKSATSEQAAAVAEIIRGAMAKSNQGFDWWDFGKNSAYALLGAFFGIVLDIMRRRVWRTARAKTASDPQPDIADV